MTQQTILLTGASGYIAKHILVRLLNDGHHVRGTLRASSSVADVRAALRPALRDPVLAENLSGVTLDLSRDDGWSAALDGIDAVMHTASPFPMAPPKDPQTVIKPAVDGTLRVLRAAHAAGVRRVILTSSTAAIMGCERPVGHVFTETDWTEPDRAETSAYSASKTLAERAAWDFAAAHDMALTTINPGFVLGAPLDAKYGTSVAVIARMLARKDPAIPRLSFNSVDVADVADLHVAALNQPTTAGQRVMATARPLWFLDIARAIDAALPQRRIVTRQAPDWLVRFLGLFDPTVRGILPDLGRWQEADAARAETILGRPLRDPLQAAAATALWLDQAGVA